MFYYYSIDLRKIHITGWGQLKSGERAMIQVKGRLIVQFFSTVWGWAKVKCGVRAIIKCGGRITVGCGGSFTIK